MTPKLFLLTVVLVLLMCIPVTADQDVYEGESIQAAINNATDGETITVHAGTYLENLFIWYPLTLKSDGAMLQGTLNSTVAIWFKANDSSVDGFTIEGHWWGTYAKDLKNISVTNNVISNYRYGIFAEAAENVTVAGNTLCNGTNEAILVIRAWNFTVSDNVASKNGWMGGILLHGGDNHVVTDNIAYNNTHGISVHQSDNNLLTGNTAYNNTEHGIYMRSAENNTISQSQTHDNLCGIYMYRSKHNLFYDNIWLDGGYCLSLSEPNVWNLSRSDNQNIVWGEVSGGNYWGAYNGIDEDGDGISDEPYDIPGSWDQDLLPLMSPSCGDCDGNGYVSANDVILAYRQAVDPTYYIPYGWVVDVDANGYISAKDVVEIYRKAVDPTYQLHCSLAI